MASRPRRRRGTLRLPLNAQGTALLVSGLIVLGLLCLLLLTWLQRSA